MPLPVLRVEPGGAPHPAGACLALAGIGKAFGGREVLRGVSLTLAPGRITALVGPNGAGKSTLVRVVLGLVRPDTGTITIDGAVVPPGAHAYRAQVGYMPQQPSFPDNLTGHEVLELVRSLRPAPGLVDDVLVGRLGLEAELGRPVRTLSGGTRQKLNAVLAFLFRPRLLLLDEPTAGLDPAASAALKDRVREVRHDGATVLLSSHVLSELEDLAQDLIVLLEGRVRFHGTLADLVQQTGITRLERAVAALLREPAP